MVKEVVAVEVKEFSPCRDIEARQVADGRDTPGPEGLARTSTRDLEDARAERELLERQLEVLSRVASIFRNLRKKREQTSER